MTSLAKKVLTGSLAAGATIILAVSGSSSQDPSINNSHHDSRPTIQTAPSNQVQVQEPAEIEDVHVPEITHKTETKHTSIPYQTITENDATMASGTTKIVQVGQNGTREEVYDITYTDGVETDRELVKSYISKEPQSEIIHKGTYVAPKPAPEPSCQNGTYTNSAETKVCRPSPNNTGGATAICRDGTYSYSQSRRGTCSHHGGVKAWL